MDASRGVLLVNLGTPQAPSAGAIRRYLREFLSDRRVVELPRALWLPILYGFILPFRPARLAHAYGAIWTADGSPLLAISRRQAAGLQARLGAATRVALAMRYGEPGIGQALMQFEQQGVRRILVLPLYPQYSATTTASVLDAVFEVLGRRRWLPEIHTLNEYHADAHYIAALAASVRRHWAQHGRGEHLLMSFHSIPQKCIDAGDPYERQCRHSAQLLAQSLELAPDAWSISFQSRIGRMPWVQPYTDEVVAALPARGARRLDVLCPGFAADCLETLEEVALRYGERFKAAGGEQLRYIAALNDDAEHLDALARLAGLALQSWPAH